MQASMFNTPGYFKAENVQPDWNDSCLEAVGGPEKAEEGTGYTERRGRNPHVLD